MRHMNRRPLLLVALLLVAGIAAAPLVPADAAPAVTYDFEKCAQGWTPSAAATWQRLPLLGEGNSYAVAYPFYGGDSTDSITSPEHAWGGGPVKLTYSVRWHFEDPATGIDAFKLEWTNDPKGKKWTRLKMFSGATNGGFPSFLKDSVTFNAPPGPFKIRFAMASDQLVAGVGPQVDNVVVPSAAPKAAACG